jgi:hypothetical protein
MRWHTVVHTSSIVTNQKRSDNDKSSCQRYSQPDPGCFSSTESFVSSEPPGTIEISTAIVDCSAAMVHRCIAREANSSSCVPIRYLGTLKQFKEYNLHVCHQITPHLWLGRAIPGIVAPIPTPRRRLPPLSLRYMFSPKPGEPHIVNVYLHCSLVPGGVGVEGVDYDVVHRGCSHPHINSD